MTIDLNSLSDLELEKLRDRALELIRERRKSRKELDLKTSLEIPYDFSDIQHDIADSIRTLAKLIFVVTLV